MKKPSLKMPSLRRKVPAEPETKGDEPTVEMPPSEPKGGQSPKKTGGLRALGRKSNKKDTDKASVDRERQTSDRMQSERQVKNHADDPVDENEVPLLAGQDAYIALSNEAPGNMVPIATRRPHTPLNKSFYKKDGPRIRVFLDEGLQGRYSKVKLAVDAYLRLGGWRSFQMKRPYILLGGRADESGVNLEILVFRGGAVVEVNEKLLPPADALDHLDVTDAAIEAVRARYPDCVVEQAGPLQRLPNPHIRKYHGNKIFRGLRPVTLNPSEQSVRNFIAPAVVTAGAMAYLLVTLTASLSAYQSERSKADALESRLFTLSSQTQPIDVMEARQTFKHQMAQPGVEEGYVEQVIRIANATQRIKGSQIKELSVPNLGPGNLAGVLSLEVPSANYPSPLLQGREVLDALAQEMGQPVRLSRQTGITENDDTITFRIEVLNG